MKPTSLRKVLSTESGRNGAEAKPVEGFKYTLKKTISTMIIAAAVLATIASAFTCRGMSGFETAYIARTAAMAPTRPVNRDVADCGRSDRSKERPGRFSGPFFICCIVEPLARHCQNGCPPPPAPELPSPEFSEFSALLLDP